MTERIKQHDYVPTNAEQLGAFAHTLLEYVKRHKTAWPHIPQARIDKMQGLSDEYYDLLEVTRGQHTPAQTLARNEKKAELTKEIRGFTNQYLRFEPVTNVDRAEMGINNHDTIRTDHVEVREKVDLLVHPDGIRSLAVDFWQHGADHKAKPPHYDGAVIIWEVLDTPPTTHSQLTHHALASRTPYRLHFDETERGKTVYIALAWQNARGIQGLYSDIKTGFVP